MPDMLTTYSLPPCLSSQPTDLPKSRLLQNRNFSASRKILTMKWNCDLSGLFRMNIVSVGTFLRLKYLSVCKDYLLHFFWFYWHFFSSLHYYNSTKYVQSKHVLIFILNYCFHIAKSPQNLCVRIYTLSLTIKLPKFIFNF